MQPAAPSPRWSKEQPGAVSAAIVSVHHVITVDSAFLQSQPTLAPFTNTTLPPPLLASLPPASLRVYSRFHVKSILALMGVKPRHIHRIVAHAFSQLSQLLLSPSSNSAATSLSATFSVPLLVGDTCFSHTSTVCLSSALWLSILRSSLTLSKHYTPSDTPVLFAICHSIVSRQQHVLILLAGASGTGKSTLASLLADRMRLSCVIGTDSVRHILRQRVSAEECPILHVSTYQAHQCIPDDADVGLLSSPYTQPPAGQPPSTAASSTLSSAASSASSSSFSSAGSSLSQAQRVKLGHHHQSLVVCRHLHSLLLSLVSSRTSAIIEGAHLLPSFLSHLLSTLSSSRTLVLPFVIYISNETKHRERFALRSHPSTTNPYIHHFTAIRTIQKHIIASKDGGSGSDGKQSASVIPTIDNTNMDRSVAAVHEIVTKIMQREGRPAAASGGTSGSAVSSMAAAAINTAGTAGATTSMGMEWSGEGRADVLREVDEMRAGAWSSKAMQRVIRMKVEKRHLFDRLREAEWKRREDDDGGKETEEDEAKEGIGVAVWNELTSSYDTSVHDAITSNLSVSTVPDSHTSPLSRDTLHSAQPAPSTTEHTPSLAQSSTPLPTHSPASASLAHSPSSSPRLPSSTPVRSSLTASSSLPRPRASSLSPSFLPSSNLSPHLSSLPPPFLQHHHHRAARPSSSDEDEYDGKRGGGAVSESEHSVSVTYSHDVPSLLAPSADDDGDGGEVEGSDEDRADEEDDAPSRGIVAIPESDDHAEDGADADNGDSDSASDGCYERAVTDNDDDRLLDGSDATNKLGLSGIGYAEVGHMDGVVDVGDVVSTGQSSSRSSNSSTRTEIILY